MNPEELTSMEPETTTDAESLSPSIPCTTDTREVLIDDFLAAEHRNRETDSAGDDHEPVDGPHTRRCRHCGRPLTGGSLFHSTCWAETVDDVRAQAAADPDATTHMCPICRRETPNNRFICDNCWNTAFQSAQIWRESNRVTGATVHAYSYKPMPLFTTLSDDAPARGTALFMGAELEVDGGSDRDALVSALSGLHRPLYLKRDGSLGSNGVEVVTHPCTLAYHKQSGMWEEIMDACRSHGYRSHDTTTCGLHIHVDRDFLGQTRAEREKTALRLVLLTYKLWPELTRFSRRSQSQLDEWARRPDVEYAATQPGLTTERIYLEADAGVCGNRYVAVNLTPAQTVEFRLFRGTLIPATLYASLELVRNLVLYAKSHTAEQCRSEATFRDILDVAPTEYLNDYCVTRGLLPV